MPVITPSPYPLVEDVMLLARSIVNDTLPGATNTPGEGQILTNNPVISPFTLPFLQSAVRQVYRLMGNTGVPTFIKDNVILTALPMLHGPQGVGIIDPTVQVSIAYNGYFDGTDVWPNLALPSDVFAMDRMWERTSGTNNPFASMEHAQFGLAPTFQGPYFRTWEYRGDAIWMPGATQVNDVRLRYHIALANIGPNADFSDTTIPLLDCNESIAGRVAKFYGIARGASAEEIAAANELIKEADFEIRNRQVRRQQSTEYHREGYQGDASGGWQGPYGNS